MTLEQLHERIGTMLKASPKSKDNIVGVADNDFKGTGGKPIKKLKHINNGMDWDAGKTFLIFEEENDAR